MKCQVSRKHCEGEGGSGPCPVLTSEFEKHFSLKYLVVPLETVRHREHGISYPFAEALRHSEASIDDSGFVDPTSLHGGMMEIVQVHKSVDRVVAELNKILESEYLRVFARALVCHPVKRAGMRPVPHGFSPRFPPRTRHYLRSTRIVRSVCKGKQ